MEGSRPAGPVRPAAASALLLVHNESLQIDRCLESLARCVDDVHVVDSGSSDDTVQRARQYTQHVHYHPYVDHASQLAWAFQHVPFKHEWLVVVDADHVVTPELARAISDAVQRNDPDYDAYYARHRYYFDGHPIRGFKPWSLRLMRRGRVTIDASEMVDYRMIFRQANVGYLAASIVEDNLNERDLGFWKDKHRKFSSRLAVEQLLRSSGRLQWSIRPSLLGNHDQRIVWLKQRWLVLPLFLRPVLYFLYRYFFRLGILDGRAGLRYHVLHALWFRWLVDANIRDLRRQLRRGECSLDDLVARFSRPAAERAA